MHINRFRKRVVGLMINALKKKIKEGQCYQRSGYYHVLAPFPTEKDDPKEALRVTLILPSIYSEHLTGGPATLLNYILAVKKEYPQAVIRLIPVMVSFLGEVEKLPSSIKKFLICDNPEKQQWEDCILSYAASKALPVPVGKRDVFIASMWPTFFLAKALKDKQQSYFGASYPVQYLIQDYESAALYPWSSFFLMAEQTYTYPQDTIAIVGTKSLADYLEEQGHSFLEKYVFDPIANAVIAELPEENSKEELFVVYGRPDTPRNCFDLIYEALLILTAHHPSVAERVTFVSVGEKHADLPLNHGAVLQSRGFLPKDKYKQLMQKASLACFFVISPHTGYVGLEFAYSGAITISNSFRTKDISKFHPNIRCPKAMTPADLAQAFVEAVQETWRNPNGGIHCAKEFMEREANSSAGLLNAEKKDSNFPFIRLLFDRFYL